MEIRDVATFLDYLGSVHQRTRRVVLCIPPADIESSPGPRRFTLGEIVRHLGALGAPAILTGSRVATPRKRQPSGRRFLRFRRFAAAALR